MWTSIFFGLIVWLRVSSAIYISDLYQTHGEDEIRLLPIGDRQYEMVQLKQPIHFYSETYDHIYVRHTSIYILMRYVFGAFSLLVYNDIDSELFSL